MTRATLVDIVICTYNRAHLLRHTLDALAKQSSPLDGTWKITVVDNNCTDGTRELIASYEQQLINLSVVAEERQGLTEARQRGFWATTAPWVAFVDDDCVPEPDWVEQVLAHVTANPDIAAFNGRNILHFEDGIDRPWVHPEMFAAGGPAEDAVVERPFLHGAGLILRRTAVERSGWLESPRAQDRRGNSLISGGDNELALRARAGGEGGGIWFVPACRLHHTVDAERLGFSYLMRLNYRLSEALPLLVAMQTPTYLSWQKYAIRFVGHRVLGAVGLASDSLITPDGGWRARLLALSRGAGSSVGYLRLLVNPGKLRGEALGIATDDYVEARLPVAP